MVFTLWQCRLLHKESALCSCFLNLVLFWSPVIAARTEGENVWLPLLLCCIMLALKAPELRVFSCRADLSSGCFPWSLTMWCCWYASARLHHAAPDPDSVWTGWRQAQHSSTCFHNWDIARRNWARGCC